MSDFTISRPTGKLAAVDWPGEDESVYFDEASGETFRLNLVERAAFACLNVEESIPFPTWVKGVARELDVSADAQLTQYLETLARQFEDLGLVKCYSA